MKTEAEFRKNLAQRLGLINWKPGTSHVVDHAVSAVIEAGIEFPAEPPVIADEISCGPDGGAFLGRIKNGLWFRLDRDGGAPFDVRATGLEVVQRFMAYPRLRAECDELVEKVQSFIGKVPVVLAEKLVPIREAVADLENTLEKGPK